MEITNVHGVSSACRDGKLREGTRVSKLDELEFNDGILIDEPLKMSDGYVFRVAEPTSDGEVEKISTVVAFHVNGYVGIDSTRNFGRSCAIYSKVKRIRSEAA